MNKQIETLYREIALDIFAVKPAAAWESASYTFKSITLMNETFCEYILSNGTSESVLPGFGTSANFSTLREEMAKLHENNHAWYTATCRLTPDGKFRFEFDYDHLPAFKIIPSPDKWRHEFNAYPRAELQEKIQDWLDKKIDADAIVRRLRDLQEKG